MEAFLDIAGNNTHQQQQQQQQQQQRQQQHFTGGSLSNISVFVYSLELRVIMRWNTNSPF